MASSIGEWVVTLDEDGQQNPQDIGRLLDTALNEQVRLVYSRPSNPPPHGLLRNLASAFAKWLFVRVLGARVGAFNSYRLMEGEVARGVAAYCGAEVYLDVALSWVVGKTAHCLVPLRQERRDGSGCTWSSLIRHFWRLVLTSGTRPLRLISLVGACAVFAAAAFSAVQTWRWFQHQIPVQGWTSTVVVVSLFGGLTLLSLGVVAEYLGMAVSMALGRPAYLIVSRPREELGKHS